MSPIFTARSMEKSTDMFKSYFYGIGRSAGVSSTLSFSKAKVDYFSRDAVFLGLKKSFANLSINARLRLIK